jgi:hypothetical protein
MNEQERNSPNAYLFICHELVTRRDATWLARSDVSGTRKILFIESYWLVLIYDSDVPISILNLHECSKTE